MRQSFLSYIALTVTLALCLSAPLTQANAGAKKPGSVVTSGYQYLELDPIMLPIVGSNGVSQVVNLVIALEVKDGALIAKAQRLQPKLKDAFIQDMYGAIPRQTRDTGGALKLTAIKERLLKVSNKILADDKHSVSDVLLQMIHQRRI